MNLEILQSEYEDMMDFNTKCNLIEFEPTSLYAGNAASAWIVKYYCKGVRKNHATGVVSVYDPERSGSPHILSISIPAEYPLFPPVLRMTTPIFHPNINDVPPAPENKIKGWPHGHVCINVWKAETPLELVVLKVGEMIEYKRHGYMQDVDKQIVEYLPTSVCKEALDWLKSNSHRIPVDDRSLVKEGAEDLVELLEEDLVEIEI